MDEKVTPEILRLRDRLHNVESSYAGVKFMLDDLREWRAEVRAWASLVDKRIDELSKTEEIAEAVSAKMKEHGSVVLTKFQLLIAILACGAAIASPLILLIRG